MKQSYSRFLLQHILIKSIPSLLLFIIFIYTVYNVIEQMIQLYKEVEQQDISILSIAFLTYAVARLLKYGVSALIVGTLFTICTSGLYFLPYLASQPRFNIFFTLKYGLKKLFRVLIFTLPINISVSLLLFIFTFLPILNVLVPFLTPFIAAILTIYYDYLFSTNSKRGLPLHDGWRLHFKQLYFSKNTFALYSIVLACLYPTIIGPFLFRPFVQYKMYMKIPQMEESDAEIYNLYD